jgi:hypothetical protein
MSEERYEQVMIRRIRRGRIALSLRKIEKDLMKFDKDAASLGYGRQDSSTNANIDLVVNRELEEMKLRMAEKDHDAVGHFVRFVRKVRTEGINDENLPQAALEYYVAHPIEIRYTTKEVREWTQDAWNKGVKFQKECDDKELAKYKPFVENYFKLAERVLERVRAEEARDPLQEMIDNINEYRNAGLVYTWKDLADMGFLNWAKRSSWPRYPVESQDINLVGILRGTRFGCPTCNAPIHVKDPYVTGKVMCFNCQTEFDYVVSESESGKVYRIANGKPFTRLGFGL